MTSPKGVDELFWGREFEDVHDQVERLEMAPKVHGIDELKLFKIGKFNMKGKSKEWLKKLTIVPTDWWTMKATMLLKYGTNDKEVRTKLGLIKQELKQRVHVYYDNIEKLFVRGKHKDGE